MLFPAAPNAANGDWVKKEQVAVRVITAGLTAEDTQNHTGTILAGLQYKLAPGWKLYWRNPGDAGTATTVAWEPYGNIANINLLWPAPKREVLELEEGAILQSFVYEGEVILPTHIAIKDTRRPTGGAPIELAFSVCADVCIPYNATLTIPENSTARDHTSARLINKAMQSIPQHRHPNISLDQGVDLVQDAQHGYFLKTTLSGITEPESVDILVEGINGVQFKAPVRQENTWYTPITIGPGSTGALEGQRATLTVTSSQGALEHTTVLPPATQEEVPVGQNVITLMLMILYALLGGLILNIMPCVLPVLSLKILGIVKHGGAEGRTAALGLLTTAAGIITSFLVLGIIAILVKQAGYAVGWGIQFQQPLFISLLTLLVLLFALNLLGRFEFRLPAYVGGAIVKTTERAEARHPLIGHFATGGFAAILATPCTAPFLGIAVGFALAQGATIMMLIFLAMGIGMAAPYLLLSVFPKYITKLPAPGPWMITVKKFLAFLLVLTALWLIWVLAQQLGTISAIILALCCLLVKYFIEQQEGAMARTVVKSTLIIISVVLALTLPSQYAESAKRQQQRIDAIWQPFKESDIQSLVRSGRVVFVDVTADWCATCKVNKLLVLHRDPVSNRLAQRDVIAMHADITTSQPHIIRFLKKYGRSGIPFNIVYGPSTPNGTILPTLLSTERVLEAIEQAK